MNTTSRVTTENGSPQLYINGEKQEGLAYLTYLTPNHRYDDFAKAGYRLFSLPVFFGSNLLNEHSGLPVFTKGIFDAETPDFSVVDNDIEMILNSCPDAFILPRLNVSLSRTWERAHPAELCESNENGKLGRACFASDIWAEEIKRELLIFLAHVEGMPYAPHIAGYQIAGGNTEEWLPLDKNGISGTRALEKYALYLQTHSCEKSEPSFYRFYSELVAQRIAEFAAVIKDATARRLVVGSFYGYTFEVPSRTSGHHALHTLLECKDIDFICSPISYTMVRALGRDHPYMLPLASVKLHHKLYFSENDTRTHLSRPVNDTPHYTAPIWFGPDRESSCEVIKMHAARALINGHAAWWFDMWGGWFADEQYMHLLKKIRELFAESRSLPMGSVTEVAVFADEEAYASLSDTSVSKRVCKDVREALGKMGTPYDLYLTSDAEQAIEKYKAVISLIPTRTPRSEKLAELAHTQKKAYLEITEQNADISTMALRAFLRQANVHLWCESDSVIYANENYLFLHTTQDAPYVLHTPTNVDLQDALTGEPFIGGIRRKKGTSYLLRYSNRSEAQTK